MPEVAYTAVRKARQQLASDICRQRQELSQSWNAWNAQVKKKLPRRIRPTVISEHALRVIVA